MSDITLDPTLKQQIQHQIDNHAVVLYMKGTPDFPQCGFSNQVVHILKQYKIDFMGVNVLSDDAIRQGVKLFSNWPTFPQLYVSGQFVGGCDIVSELDETGELKSILPLSDDV